MHGVARLMARLGFAERDDLAQWGRTRAAAGDLPGLSAA